MNALIDGDGGCKTSMEDCAKPVREVLEKIATDGKFFERKDINGKFEARGVEVLAAPVLVWAYLLHKLANEPQPEKIPLTWDNGDPIADHKPVAIDIPVIEYRPDITGTETTTTSAPARDRTLFGEG